MLIVEDDALARGIVGRRFSRLGWQVSEATSDEGALDALVAASGDIDVVVTERMPLAFNGFDLARRIRALDGPAASTPVVVLSGLDRPSDISGVLAAGADGFVSKPFDLADLEAEVARVLAQQGGPEPEAARP
jgi:DNA-binding response OmpR family regulator